MCVCGGGGAIDLEKTATYSATLHLLSLSFFFEPARPWGTNSLTNANNPAYTQVLSSCFPVFPLPHLAVSRETLGGKRRWVFYVCTCVREVGERGERGENGEGDN